MATTPTLTALVVAHNEAAQLAACLNTLTFVDQIVMVLDRTTDASAAIAEAYGAHIVSGAWPIEGERRAAGVAAASSDWVLEVDADERVPAALANEIRQQLAMANGDFFRIPFANYIGQRWVQYGWGAQFGVGAKLCLFRRGAKQWGNQRVHPKVTMSGQLAGVLTNRMTHYVDRNITDVLARLDRYTTLYAADLRQSGEWQQPRQSLQRNIGRFFARFYKCYVLRQGWREGGYGLLLAACAGLYPLLACLKAAEMTEPQ